MGEDPDVSRTNRIRWRKDGAVLAVWLLLPWTVAAQSSSWPDFPSPGSSAWNNGLPQRPADLSPPPREPEFPQPDAPPGSLAQPPKRLSSHLTLVPAGTTPTPNNVMYESPPASVSSNWQGSATSATPLPQRTAPATPSSGLMPERTPRNFGQGWRHVVTQGPADFGKPAATLSAPKVIQAPNVARPASGWYGYDTYRTPELPAGGEIAKDLAAELAPFMKYAHRWRPSSINTAFGPETTGYARPGQAIVPPAKYELPAKATPPTPSVTTPVGPDGQHRAGFRAVEATSSTGVTPIPAITVPVDAMGQPVLQPIGFQPADKPSTAPQKYVIPLSDPDEAAALPSGVEEKIRATCQGKVRGLQLERLGSSRLRLRFQAKDQIDAELLTNMLSALPELAMYRVEFEVQIGP